MRRRFRPHQLKAFRFAKARPNALGLFLEMRLGKTMVAIRWAKRFLDDGPVLVLAPLSVVPVWVDELALDGETDVAVIDSKEHVPDAQWLVTNYEKLFFPGKRSGYQQQPQPTPIALHQYGTVILDESALIRNPRAARTKMVVNHLSRAKHRACLSGLPNPEQELLDFYPQMQFLNGSLCGCQNFWVFRNRFFTPSGWGLFQWRPKRGTVETVRTEINQTAITMSRKQAGFKERVVFETRYCDMPMSVRKRYQQAEREFAVGEHETKWRVVVDSWLTQLTGGRPSTPELQRFDHSAKLSELVSLLNGELKREPVIVWFRGKREGEAIEEFCIKAKIKGNRIDGSTPYKERIGIRKRFDVGKIRVVALQIETAQFGLNLSHASTAIYFSLPYGQSSWKQSQDRIVDISKKDSLLNIILTCPDSVDEDIRQALMMKHIRSQGVLRYSVQQLKERVARDGKFLRKGG